MLECNIEEVLSNMTNEERCTPWFYPPIDQGLRLCSPFEAIAFKNRMDILASKSCKVYTQRRVTKVIHQRASTHFES